MKAVDVLLWASHWLWENKNVKYLEHKKQFQKQLFGISRAPFSSLSFVVDTVCVIS